MRSARGMLASPKCPMLNVIDQTTASATTNIAAAVNTGRQRTAIHNKRENTNATGKAVAHCLCGREMKKLLSAARVVSAIVPSRSSRRGGGMSHSLAEPNQQWGTRARAEKAGHEPNLKQVGRKWSWFDKGDGNCRAGPTHARCNRTRH